MTDILARVAADIEAAVTAPPQKRDFRGERPAKDQPCVVPGCSHRFRPSTQYSDFLSHYRAKHSGKELRE